MTIHPAIPYDTSQGERLRRLEHNVAALHSRLDAQDRVLVEIRDTLTGGAR